MSCLVCLSPHAFKNSIKQHKVIISIRAYKIIVTVSDQWNRKKTSTKIISTGKVKYGREENTSIN